MLLSIIISLKNDSTLLLNSLLSIEKIMFKSKIRFEVVIVDSNSNDFPFSVVSKFINIIDIIWISEFDNGIYQAWNKGISASKGTHVCFLGAGDEIQTGFIEVINEINKDCDFEIITSKSKMMNNKIMIESGKPYIYNEFCQKFTTNHSCLIYNKQLFNVFGNFDESFSIASDYQFLLRIGKHLKPKFVDTISCTYLLNGISNSKVKVLWEVFIIRRKLKIHSLIFEIFLLIKGMLIFYFRKYYGY